ncbi:conserved hypothetical protein [Synechococcus sp. WH 8103]|jgi:hypothetical protein|nr:hypothetical protein SynRS9915_00578 [Synechococcus sp. RS9915]CRY91344.1 conserved hypothetical protein [Synechococcus sp. WH 8103]
MLLQLWVVGTLTLVLGVAAVALWWERQLPRQLRHAINSEDWSQCLEVTEQMAALRWLGEGAPQEQAHCRRQRAAQFWNNGDQASALVLQRQLVQSRQADAKDLEQLQVWRRELRELAMQRFRAGELETAITLLQPLDRAPSSSSNRFSDSLRETWNRNRLEAERLDQLVQQERWWEALDSHNRLDHPWWQAQTQPQRRMVEQAIARIGDSQEHHQHGDARSDVISGSELNRAVQQQLDLGLEPWQAFEVGCRTLGGQVEEDGPESFCRRRDPTGA